MVQFPKKLTELLLNYIKGTASTHRKGPAQAIWQPHDLKHFATGALELSKRFTSERSRLRGDYLSDPKCRSGYLLYFLPINFTKATALFRLFPEQFWQGSSLRFLDLGSGPGTGSLAFLTEAAGRLPKAALEFHLVDRNKRILQDGKHLLESWHRTLTSPASLKIHLEKNPLHRVQAKGQYHVILLHHVLNEWKGLDTPGRATALLQWVHHHLQPGGILALVEPALKRPGRDLMALRDALLTDSELKVLAPCLHEHPCPMLSGTKGDWCHFYVDWEEPQFMKSLDQILGNQNRFLKMSYVILQKHGPEHRRKDTQFRVVSNRMATRGKTEVILCGKSGRIRLSLLDRHQSSKNQAITKVKRGDLVEWEEWREEDFTDSGQFRLNKNSQIKILS